MAEVDETWITTVFTADTNSEFWTDFTTIFDSDLHKSHDTVLIDFFGWWILDDTTFVGVLNYYINGYFWESLRIHQKPTITLPLTERRNHELFRHSNLPHNYRVRSKHHDILISILISFLTTYIMAIFWFTREKHGKCPGLKQCRVPLDIQKFSIFEGQKINLNFKKK